MSSKLSSYPQPHATSFQVEEPQYLRPLVPLRQTQAHADVPSSASLPRPKQDALPGYTRSSHIVPAAFPRTLPPDSPLRDAAVSARNVQPKALAKALIDTKLAFESPEVQKVNRGGSETVMWNCVDRYVRFPSKRNAQDDRHGITLFLAHPNGFPRQVWEPTLAQLVSLVAANPESGVHISEMWSFEAVQHGDSAVINAGHHSDVFDWQDHVRDIVNFLSYYLPDVSQTEDLPKTLNRVVRQGGPRQVVGVGHSFGGATLALAAVTHPTLFESLILVEPLIVPTSFKRGPILDRLLHGTLRKPNKWPSGQAAKATFAKYLPTNTWDTSVVDVIMEHGLVHSANDPASSSLMEENTTVRLKMHPVDEAVVYCEWLVPYEAWTELKKLDPRVALHWIMSGEANEITGGYAATQNTVWRRPVNSTNTRLPGVRHLESPRGLAAELFRYLADSKARPLSKL